MPPLTTGTLQPVKHRVRAGTVHVDLGEQREGDAVAVLGEVLYLCLGPRFLTPKLRLGEQEEKRQ